MRKLLTRTVSLILVLLMIASTLAGCRQSGSKDKEKEGRDDPAEEVYEGENGYVLAVNDYNGASFAITDRGSGLMTDEETGESLNDATFRRNAKVESLYNIDLDITEYDGSFDFETQIAAIIMSGTDTYQLIGNGMGVMATHTMTTGYYQNLLDLAYFDFDQAWWPSEFMKNARIGNNLYTAVGNMTSSYYDLFTAIFFNKELAENYGIGDLYELTREGKWTIDKMIECAEKAEVDLDGDGMMDPKIDQFGLTIHRAYPTHAFVTAFDIQMTDYDSEGMPTILPLSERYVDVYEKLNVFFHSNCVNYRSRQEDAPVDDTSFLEGRALFEGNRMFFAGGYREMEKNFGILPYPKWDETQENYRSYSDTEQVFAYAIPITTNGDVAANIFEAMSYFGHQMVLPAYYDKVLKGQTTRDAQSGEMLDIIYSNASYQFVQIYANFFYPAPTILLADSLRYGDALSRLYASNRRMYEKKMQDLIKMLDIVGAE